MTTNGNFHLHFSSSGQTYDFDFLEREETSSDTVLVGGRNFLLQGESKQIAWLKSHIPELNSRSNISLQKIQDRLQLLNVEELELPSTTKVHFLAIDSLGRKKTQKVQLPRGKWSRVEQKLKRKVSERYWDKLVDGKPGNDHSAMFDFIRGSKKFDPESNVNAKGILQAIEASNKDLFIQHFESLSMGQVGVINHDEGLNALPPIPPRDPKKTDVTSEDIQQIRQYMKDTGFSGVVCISDSVRTHTIKSGNVTDPKIPFAMHSVGKMFTGVLAIKMIEEGIIAKEDLDQPIQLDSSVLKSLLKSHPNIADHLTKVGAPTLRQIMLHQSGLGDYLGDYGKAIKEAIENQQKTPEIESPVDFLKYADGKIIDLKDGESHYSNIGILLVGLAIQHHYNQFHRSNKSYQEILNEFVIKPANLESFSVEKPDHACFNEHDLIAPHIMGGPAGGYWISAEDLLKFGKWTSEQCSRPRFSELVDMYGGEFSPQYGEISHGGQTSSSTSFLGSFLPNRITISALSDRPFQAAVLEGTIRRQLFPDKQGKMVLEELTPRLYSPEKPPEPKNILKQMEAYNIPGVRIALIDNYEVVWSQGFGKLENKDIRIQAASISKTLAAMAVLSLIKDGNTQLKAGLDTDVREILGEQLWKKLDPDNKTEDGKYPVTIRTLLSHTAGITLGTGESGFQGYPRSDEITREIEVLEKELTDLESASGESDDLENKKRDISEQLTHFRRIQKKLPTTEEILIGRNPENSGVNSGPIRVTHRPSPDGKMRYQGGGPTLLQMVVEKVTGQDFDKYVTERVLLPLNMDHTTYSSEGVSCSQGFGEDGEPIPGGWRVYPELAAAGAFSTPEDLAKLMIEIQKAHNGKSESTVGRELSQEMLEQKKGLGVAVPSIEGSHYFFHEGANAGFRCIMIGNTDGQGVVIMTNSDNGEFIRDEILARVAKAYEWENAEQLEQLKPLMNLEEAKSVDAKAWFSLAEGVYKLYPKKDVEISLKIYRGDQNKIMGQINERFGKRTNTLDPFEIVPISATSGVYRNHPKAPFQKIEFSMGTNNQVVGINIFGDSFMHAVLPLTTPLSSIDITQFIKYLTYNPF